MPAPIHPRLELSASRSWAQDMWTQSSVVFDISNVKWVLFNIHAGFYCLNYEDENESRSFGRQNVVLKGPNPCKCH